LNASADRAVAIAPGTSQQHAHRFLGLPLLTLIVGLLATFAVVSLYQRGKEAQDLGRFEREVETARSRLEERISALWATLRGAAGFFTVHPEATAAEFQQFYRRQRIEEHMPGTLGVGFSRRISPGEVDGVVASMRSQGFTDFHIRPMTPREEYHAILYLEPLHERNRVALGFDMFTEPTRRAAMQQARDSGYAAASGKVTLVQETEAIKQPGFLMYAPIYRGEGAPDTLEARRRLFVGFAYSPLRAGDLLNHVFENRQQPMLNVAVFDGDGTNPESLLYQSSGAAAATQALSQTLQVETAQRAWTLVFTTRPEFHAASASSLGVVLAISGGLLSLLLAGLTYAQSRARALSEASAGLYRAERERFRTTLSSIGDAVIATDREARVIFINPVAEDLTGWPARDAVGRHAADVFRIVNESTRRGVESPVERVLREGAVVGLANHTTLLRRDGTEVSIDDSGAPIRDADGSIAGAVLVFRDISDRKRSQRELLKSEARKSAILESALDCIITMDARGRIMDFNPAAERTFGHRREEVIGKTVAETIIPPRLREAHAAGMRRYFETGHGPVLGRRIEIQALRSDGVEIPVELAIVVTSAVTDGVDSVFFTAYLRDLTERNASREAVRRSEEQYRTLVDQVRDYAIFRVTPEGAPSTWNQGVKRVLGYDEVEFLSLPAEALFAPEDVAAGAPHRELGVAAMKGQVDTDRWMVRKDGTRFWMMGMTSAVRDDQGRLVGFTQVMRDYTGWKLAEQERDELLRSEQLARAELERAGRMKDEFVATLSHELRTPLTAILGWAQLLGNKAAKPEDLAVGLQTIERNARAQAQMVNDLLDVSRITSGKLRLDVQRVDLAEVVKNAVESMQPAADAKGIRLQTVIEQEGNEVSGDPSRLQQVFWNILSNAVKFTPRGGRAQVVVRRVDSSMEVAITDSGKGIEPEFLPNVFERFRQEDSSITRRFGGLGLGLSIVKHLVELHGGTVEAFSEGENKGSTFTVRLPARAVLPHSSAVEQGAGSEAAWPPFDESQLHGVRILVVDDEADSRGVIQRVLEQAGAQVDVARSVDDAVERFASFRPDVLLSDIGMPDKDGYALVRWVRSLPAEQGGRTPAAALTALARSDDRRAALLAGYQVHVSKPIEPSELVAVAASLAMRSDRKGRTSGASNG
jgi:PAS domain S-box-containing protein